MPGIDFVARRQAPGHLPDIVLLAEELGRRIIGFIEVDLRPHAEGCNPARPVGYIERWYVTPPYRRKRVGATLVAVVEA